MAKEHFTRLRNLKGMGFRPIRQQLHVLRPKLLRMAFVPELVAQSFALVRSAARRTLGLSHFPVQLIGGSVMLDHGEPGALEGLRRELERTISRPIRPT